MHNEETNWTDHQDTSLGWFELEVLIDQPEYQGIILSKFQQFGDSNDSDQATSLHHSGLVGMVQEH